LESDWYSVYDPEVRTGYECCSQESISFHVVHPTAHYMYAIHRFLYDCPQHTKDEYFSQHGEDFFDRFLAVDLHFNANRS
jgi:hypothetical protein